MIHCGSICQTNKTTAMKNYNRSQEKSNFNNEMEIFYSFILETKEMEYHFCSEYIWLTNHSRLKDANKRSGYYLAVWRDIAFALYREWFEEHKCQCKKRFSNF